MATHRSHDFSLRSLTIGGNGRPLEQTVWATQTRALSSLNASGIGLETMLLIATDEAGYGPKLGPLVIAATAWRIPGKSSEQQRLHNLFAALRNPQPCCDTSVMIDDSKAVYKPGGGLSSLHAAVSASHHWCGRWEANLPEILSHLVGEDTKAIGETPWLVQLSEEPFLQPVETEQMRTAWRRSGIDQLDTKARVFTAAKFNHFCNGEMNKAELLSESTLLLVRQLWQTHQSDQQDVTVFCDRHGGRRYYAGILQHVFPEAIIQVVSESKEQSIYRLRMPGSGSADANFQVHFTVKGDSFTPVAMSSIHAKYLRERFMESFNRFFLALHRGDSPLAATAGYPVDADRFLRDIASTLQREGITAQQLVRSR